MGTPIPPLPPVWELTKHYAVYIDSWFGVDCGGIWDQRGFCCRTGQQVLDWMGRGGDCVTELCFAGGFTTQRLVNAHGPYDGILQCQADQV